MQQRCTERRTVLGRPPGVASIPLGASTGPYRFSVHTGRQVSWVHHAPPPSTMMVPACTVPAEEPGPGLRARFRSTVMLSSRTTSLPSFLYLRSIEPGHQDRHQTIRGKCWIATRAQLAGPAGLQGPQMGDFQRPRGLLEASGTWFWTGSGPLVTLGSMARDPDPG